MDSSAARSLFRQFRTKNRKRGGLTYLLAFLPFQLTYCWVFIILLQLVVPSNLGRVHLVCTIHLIKEATIPPYQYPISLIFSPDLHESQTNGLRSKINCNLQRSFFLLPLFFVFLFLFFFLFFFLHCVSLTYAKYYICLLINKCK